MLLNVGGNGVVIDPPLGARLYPWRPFSIAVQTSFINFECVIAFHAFAHYSSLFMQASIDLLRVAPTT
jgi:hypothetical protein